MDWIDLALSFALDYSGNLPSIAMPNLLPCFTKFVVQVVPVNTSRCVHELVVLQSMTLPVLLIRG